MIVPDSVGNWWISFSKAPEHVIVSMEAPHMCAHITMAPVFQILVIYFLSTLCIELFLLNVLVDVFVFAVFVICVLILFIY